MPVKRAAVPLMIGVTGHRDLVADEVASLENAVAQFFTGLMVRFPGLPLLVTTPLADGADRLVAGVARRMGLDLDILLPMPLELYRREFDAASDGVLHEMLGWGEVIELPLLGALGPDGRLPAADADVQFELLGIHLASHSHILLALWDGADSEAPGGTAQVVQFHQQNVVHLISGVEPRSAIDFSEDESDLAYHIACSRQGTGPPASGRAPGAACWLTRDDVEPCAAELPERYAAVFSRQERLNEDLAELPPVADRPAPPGCPAAVETDVGNLFEAADALAVRFQKRALNSLRAMYLLAALAGVSFIVYADFPDQDRVIWLYLLFFVLGFAVYLMERRGAWYRRYLDYRGLAEGLRVQYHWALAGVKVENAAEFPHDRFLKREELELGWIRNVMRYAGRRTDVGTHAEGDVPLESVIAGWVGDEEHGETGYYRSRVQRLLHRNRVTTRLSLGAFVIALLAALALALLQAGLPDLTVNVLVAVMVGLPYLAAVRSSYAHRISERELIAQYAHMHRIFSNAQRLLAGARGAGERRAILLALGNEALLEVGHWILRQRERPASGEEIFHTG